MIASKSRTKKSSDVGTTEPRKPKAPALDDFLAKRDYVGAIALLEFQQAEEGSKHPHLLEWMAYCHYHNAEHDKALAIYRQILQGDDPDPVHYTYAAACLYYMGLYEQAESLALQGPKSQLQTRLLFHCAHRASDEAKLMHFHQQLTESLEDQLSLASIHCLRGHFQEAADVYKRLLLEHREFLALNVAVALCYCKLDYYDVSLELLAVYLQQHPDSAVAVNLKACNLFRLYTGKAAEAEVKVLQQQGISSEENALIRHNLVVFRNGDNALQVLPPMLGLCTEVRLNLAVYHLRRGAPQEAFALIKAVEPVAPQEYILKGVVHVALGQATQSAELLKTAEQCFQLVGASATECDTIPGRQCMASCFYLLRQWEDVLVYLSSIKSYFPTDSDFNWNLGIASAAQGQWADAEEALLAVQAEGHVQDPAYVMWLAKTLIMRGKPHAAWELYLQQAASDKSFLLAQLIANECYRMGQFLVAARAFDVMERLEPSVEFWEGKQGACAGVVQMVAASKEGWEAVREVLTLLARSRQPNSEAIARSIRRWALDNQVPL